MTPLLAWMSAPAVYDLGWTLLHFLWQGLLLALLLEAVLPLLRGARARHNLALAVLVLMALAPLATFLFLHGQGSALSGAGQAMEIAVDGVTYSLGSVSPPVGWSGWLVLLWLAGIAALSLRALGGWYLAEGLRRRETLPLPAELLARCHALAQRLEVSRPVRFFQSQRVDVPVMIGWLRPVILIPVAAITGLAPQHLEALVMHELAHIRRNDAFINILLLAAETVLFYHPAIWWVSRRIRIERENCCDDLAVSHCGDAVLYVEAMTTLAGRLVPALALAADGGSLKDRAARLLGVPADGRRYSLPALAGLVAAGLVIGTMAMAQPAAPADLAPGGLVFEVTENSVLDRVTFTGNSRISTQDLVIDTRLKPGAAITRAGVEADITRLKELYRRNGKYFARIDARAAAGTANRAALTFAITEGPTIGVARIDFRGNKAFDAGTLRAQIATRESAWYRLFATNDNYDPDRIAYDRELLRRFYAGRGYAGFAVRGVTAELAPDGRNFHITFDLDETGQRSAAATPWESELPAPSGRPGLPPPGAKLDFGLKITDDKGVSPPITITADSMKSSTSQGVPNRFNGNVVIRQGDTTIRANSARAEIAPSLQSLPNARWQRLVFDGDVVVTGPKGTRRVDHLEIEVVEHSLQVEGNNAPAGGTRQTALTPPAPATVNLARLLLPLPPGAPQEAVDNTMKVARQIGEAARSCAALEAISQDPVLRGSVYMDMGNYNLAGLHPEVQKALVQTKAGEAAIPVLLDVGVGIFARCS